MTGVEDVWEGWGDLMASVPVEGRGYLVAITGFSDLSREALVLSHYDLSVIYGVTMTSGRGVFHGGIVDMFAISMITEPDVEHSSHLTNICNVTVTVFYTIHHPTLFIVF